MTPWPVLGAAGVLSVRPVQTAVGGLLSIVVGTMPPESPFNIDALFESLYWVPEHKACL